MISEGLLWCQDGVSPAAIVRGLLWCGDGGVSPVAVLCGLHQFGMGCPLQ